MNKYYDVIIKNPPEKFQTIHIDMTGVSIGSRFLCGWIAKYCRNHKGNKSFSEFYNNICNSPINIVIDNIFEADPHSLLNPGILIMFGSESFEDLPENWGLVIKNAVERYN